MLSRRQFFTTVWCALGAMGTPYPTRYPTPSSTRYPTPSPTRYPTALPTPPTPPPTPPPCGTSTSNGVLPPCACADDSSKNPYFSDTRRRSASSQSCAVFYNGSCIQYRTDYARRRRALPLTPRYYCKSNTPTPAPTPPRCGTGTSSGVIDSSCACADASLKKSYFSDSRRRTGSCSIMINGVCSRYNSVSTIPRTPRYYCGSSSSGGGGGGGGGGSASFPTPNFGAPTRSPTRYPTRAPTPVPRFRRGRPKLVRRTRLRGFTRESFTEGFQTAFRRAYARRLGGTEVEDVIITNIRDFNATALALEAAASAAPSAPPAPSAPSAPPAVAAGAAGGLSRRVLASSAEGVTFDVQVAADTAAQVAALKAEVTGPGSPLADSAVVAAFEVELSAVVQSGEFSDVSSTLVMDGSTLEVVELGTTTATETSVPTPAPLAGDGASPLVPAIAGVAALAAVVGAIAWRRKASSASNGAASPEEAPPSGREHANPLAKAAQARRAAPAQAEGAAAVVAVVATAPSEEENANHNSLPQGWEMCTDPTSGHTYYYNGRTGQTSWELPGGAPSAAL
jgi:hypothetical protein